MTLSGTGDFRGPIWMLYNHQVYFEQNSSIWHIVWHPWGCVNSGDILVLRFVFDIFVPQRHLAIFFILFKLKPDITCIDLTSIKSDNITF